MTNSHLRKPFERIDKSGKNSDGYVYYGQINSRNEKHGLGTILYDNGFCYQGMFVNNYREGLGFTYDMEGNKYKGEHKNA